MRITSISPVTESGFSLSNADTYLGGIPEPHPFLEDTSIFSLITHEEFWSIMMYFLRMMNEQFRLKRELKLKQMRKH